MEKQNYNITETIPQNYKNTAKWGGFLPKIKNLFLGKKNCGLKNCRAMRVFLFSVKNNPPIPRILWSKTQIGENQGNFFSRRERNTMTEPLAL